MREGDRERRNRLEHRCRRQETENDQRRQRDDAGHIGRGRSARRLPAISPRRRSAACHGPHSDAHAEEDRQDGSAACEDKNRFRDSHDRNLPAPALP